MCSNSFHTHALSRRSNVHQALTCNLSTPATIEALLAKAQALAGQSLSELAQAAQIAVPRTLHRHKGWIGQLLEWHLGAEAGNQALPDFIALGIELKTLPLQASGKPKESTYVCTANLDAAHLALDWRESTVYQKLARVLWVPLEADPQLPIAERRVLNPFLWRMPEDLEVVLKKDWEELMDGLLLGQAAQLSARCGTYLQIRPKAAHSGITTEYLSAEGQFTALGPKGFYLRPCFTHRLLGENAAAARIESTVCATV